MSVSCGALEVGEIWTTLFGIATDSAIGIVALEAISPISTFALSDFTSFVAASTDALACVCPSSEPTRGTWIDFERPSALSAAFWRTIACLTARSRFAPYAARSPVNGSTSPILSVNAQFLGAAAERESRAEPTETATVNASIATPATAAPLIFLTTTPPLECRARLTGAAAARKVRSMQARAVRSADDRDAPLRHPRHRGANRGPVGLRARGGRLLRGDRVEPRADSGGEALLPVRPA